MNVALAYIAVVLSSAAILAAASEIENGGYVHAGEMIAPVTLVSGKSDASVPVPIPAGLANAVAPVISLELRAVSLPEIRENFLISVCRRGKLEGCDRVGTFSYFVPPKLGESTQFFVSVPDEVKLAWGQENGSVNLIVRLEAVDPSRPVQESAFEITNIELLTE